MIEITFRIPNALGAALAPMVAKKAKGLEPTPKVQVALEARGLSSVDELTPAQQLKLVVRMWLMHELQKYRRRLHSEEVELDIQAIEAEFPTEDVTP